MTKMIKTNSYWILTGVGLLFLVVYFLFFHQTDFKSIRSRSMCKDKEKALNIEFSGVLIRKYEDKWDHLVKKVEIGSGEDLMKSSFLENEVSGLFGKIRVGDTLFKRKNSLEVIVIDGGDSISYFLDYRCP